MIDLQARTSKGMTNVGTARINLSPGDVAFAGAASGVVTRATCQVIFLQCLNKTGDLMFSALGCVQDTDAASSGRQGWQIQRAHSSGCNIAQV